MAGYNIINMPKHSSPHLLRKWVGDLLLAFQILSGAFC